MTWPVPTGIVTAGYDQLRPLSAPREERWHIHGAIDIKAPVGTPIEAPEPGLLYYFAAIRPNRNRKMSELRITFPGFIFDDRPYFYDIFGALAVLRADSGRTHIFAHSWLNQLYNEPPQQLAWRYKESPEVERFPLMAFYTVDPVGVEEGDRIAYIGNAGYSTGPHVHYEIHDGGRWQAWDDRPRPDIYFAEAR